MQGTIEDIDVCLCEDKASLKFYVIRIWHKIVKVNNAQHTQLELLYSVQLQYLRIFEKFNVFVMRAGKCAYLVLQNTHVEYLRIFRQTEKEVKQCGDLEAMCIHCFLR